MQLYVLLAGVFAVLALTTYLAKRRFGLTVAALVIGYVLSMLWANTVAMWIVALGVTTSVVPLEMIVEIAMILVPGLLVVSNGAVVKKPALRIAGAIIVGLVACAFVAGPLLQYSILGYEQQQMFELFTNNTQLIIGIGLVLAWLDIVLTKAPKPPKEDGKH